MKKDMDRPLPEAPGAVGAPLAHTPGPWYQDEAGICSAGEMVAQLCIADEWWGVEEDELPVAVANRLTANARLIAAAPDLLTVARLGVVMIESMARVCPLTPTGEVALAEIRAAIQKATIPEGGEGSSSATRPQNSTSSELQPAIASGKEG